MSKKIREIWDKKYVPSELATLVFVCKATITSSKHTPQEAHKQKIWQNHHSNKLKTLSGMDTKSSSEKALNRNNNDVICNKN